ncbi:MAG: threonine synthase [Thermomicrobiales bacterium]
MFATHYQCDRCARTFPLTEPLNTCPACGGLLEVQYDLARLGVAVTPQTFANRERTIWRWREFLPLSDPAQTVSLGEGGTPLVPSRYAGPRLGLSRLSFKNDALMPTGSFKDRGFSLAISFARSLGITRGLTYTSGNAGASFGAYAARAGIEAVILVEYLANPAKVAMIGMYGATLATLDFDSMEQITAMLAEATRAHGLYQFVNFINPIRHEAMKTYAYEICATLDWQPPDLMIHPVGTGGGIWGAWKGFRELHALGWIDRLPQMAAVQPAASGHIVQAFQQGARSAERFGDPSKTIAQSIAADAPIQGGTRVLNAIYDSGDWAEGVTDEEILEAMRWLGREGIAAEPAAAAPLAALRRAMDAGRVDPEARIVCVVTGSALKQPEALARAAGQPHLRIDARYPELRDLLARLWKE